MSRPTQENVTLRRRMVEVLRADGRALSTRKIAMLVEPRYNNFRHHAVIYPQLRALERAGLIERTRKPRYQEVFWRLADADSDAAMNELLGE